MVFSSLLFLYWFLPTFLVAYFLLPNRLKNIWLFTASLCFYAWGAPRFLPIMAASIILDYYISKALTPTSSAPRRLLLGLSIGINLSLLAYFKYSDFFFEQLNATLHSLNVQPIPWAAVALPIGISFITFEKISYAVDVYRGRTPPADNLLSYGLFIFLFPHLIAGPIFRYHDIAGQLTKRTHSIDDAFYGAWRFSVGLAKKVLIADCLSEVADYTFGLRARDLTPGYAWLGILCYTLQIYFDFSGYSDMAIGLGRMLGFHFLENFDRPYRAKSISEFWHRWHISLSNWMKEYLYIPLGGNRISPARTYFNLWLVFLLSGIWHGANWTFLAWGAIHGTFLMLEKMFLLKFLKRLPETLQWLLTLLAVMFAWVFFRAENLTEARQFLSAMFSLGTKPLWGDTIILAHVLDHRAAVMLALGSAIAFIPWRKDLLRPAVTPSPRDATFTAALRGLGTIVLIFLSTLSLINSDFHPFIYFRF